MPKSKDKEPSPSFEELSGELESIVAKLEAGDLSLDESLALFERGTELAKKCTEMLDKAELRIKELVPQANDELGTKDFEEE
jgi:exodeoxyribonuclease VII small subunit